VVHILELFVYIHIDCGSYIIDVYQCVYVPYISMHIMYCMNHVNFWFSLKPCLDPLAVVTFTVSDVP
jgi:hypothetical protein